MKVAIIGGGLAGLGAAYELAEHPEVQVTLFERSAVLGGLASTVKVSGEPLEVFYHHMFPTYYDFFEAARKIGIQDKIIFKRTKSGILYGGKIFPFDSPFDLLRFFPLSMWERLRTGFGLVRIKFARSEKKFENVGAEDWSRRHFGSKPHTVLWEPLLKSKFGNFTKKVGMAWFWGRIYERPSRFGYFLGSFQTFFDAIDRYLQKMGVAIILGKPVKKIETTDDGQFLITMENGPEAFDHVVVAVAPKLFVQIAVNLLPEDFREYLSRFDYLGAICAVLVLKQPLTDYYWLNINDPGFPFLGIIEQANFISPKVYGGLYPVYLSKYLDVEGNFYALSDEDIWKQYLPALKKINKEFDENWIVEKYIFRTPLAQPIITQNYSKIRPVYKTPISGLWWVSMSHVYPWDRGMDHAFRLGRELARQILSDDLKKQNNELTT